jgi:hypothetical protein
LAAVIEVRTYRTVPGCRETIMTAMASRAMPVQAEIGMKMLGPFPSCEDADTFVWLRAFPDAASRDTMKAAFYGGELWLNELEAEVLPLIAQYESVLVEDTVGLWPVWPEGNR